VPTTKFTEEAELQIVDMSDWPFTEYTWL